MIRVAVNELVRVVNYLELLGMGEVGAERLASGALGPHINFPELLVVCNKLGLRVSAQHLTELVGQYKMFDGQDPSEQKWEAVAREAPLLGATLRRELTTKLFLTLPEESSIKLFGNERPFDNDKISVNDAFPEAVFDIQEAANCLALSRATGCVCHLMRVLEAGLCALAIELKIPWPEQNNWQNVINKIETAIAQFEKGMQPFPPDFRAKRQIYAEAATQFTHFKDAWRNYAMHFHATYDDPKAQIIFTSVGEFMRALVQAGIKSLQLASL
jgi:hypothetical protein